MQILTNSKIKEGLFFLLEKVKPKKPRHIVGKRGSVKKSERIFFN